jgi:hypothetical protein
MDLRRVSFAWSLLVLTMIGCDGRQPLAPSFAVVGTPASLTAGPAAFNQIDLIWQENSRNETGFEVHRSTTGSSGSFTLRATTATSTTTYSDFGLTGSTQYCYKVRAFRTTGRKTTYSEFTNTACATTPRTPVSAAPSGLHATPHLGYAISVGWTDNSADETAFRVERAASSGGPWGAPTTLGPNVTSLEDYRPTEQLACYRVFAVNSYGDSDPSNVDCTAIPAAPTDLAATVPADGGVDLTWTDNSAVEDGVEVQRAPGGVDWSVIATLPANTTRYHDAGVQPDITYWYLVRATKHGGTSGNSNTVQAVVATTPPLAPASADAVPYASNIVTISWLDGSSNEAGFRVERSTDGGASWVAAGTTGVDETAFWDQGLLSEQRACYRVVAFNHVGDSPASNTDCTTPPAGPTGLTATGVDAATIDLAWIDNSAVEDGYEVWVDDGYGNWYSIASLGPNTTTFQYTDPYSAYWYVYYVVATKDAGYSDWSNGAYATPPASVASVRTRSLPGVAPLRAPSPRTLPRARRKP